MGIEADEALVGNGLYPRAAAWYSWRVFGRDVPVMLLSYLGAAKAWICAVIFAVWGPSAISLRLPTAMLGACTVALFWRLLKDVSGIPAAWIGAVLLATDTAFLLLTTIDFGPVALQLFLKTAALALFVRWFHTHRTILFAGSWFLFGLALWDKAAFMWIAAGLAAGAAVVFPSVARRVIRPRLIATAAVALGAGAFPLIVYNVARPLDTIRANAKLAGTGSLAKLRLLQETIDGSVLWGFYTADQPPPDPGHVETPLRRVLSAVSAIPGTKPRNWTLWVFIAAVMAIPAIWRTPARAPALFGLVSFAAGWLAMALTSGAGAAAHHIALLWPMHFMVIAVVIAASSRFASWLPVGATVLLAAMGLRCTSGYFVDLVRNGPAIRWTDAIDPLTNYLERSNARRVFVVDWGILESVNLLSEGSVPVIFGNAYYSETAAPDRSGALRAAMIDSGTLFVSHTAAYEQTPGVGAGVDKFAAVAGYRKEAVTTIHDRFGRPTFDIFRFRP
jgi:hypothetical protein